MQENLRSGKTPYELSGWQRLGIVLYVPWVLFCCFLAWTFLTNWQTDKEWLQAKVGDPMSHLDLYEAREFMRLKHQYPELVPAPSSSEDSSIDIVTILKGWKSTEPVISGVYSHHILLMPLAGESGKDIPEIMIEGSIDNAELARKLQAIKHEVELNGVSVDELAETISKNLFAETSLFEEKTESDRRRRSREFWQQALAFSVLIVSPLLFWFLVVAVFKWVYRGFKKQR